MASALLVTGASIALPQPTQIPKSNWTPKSERSQISDKNQDREQNQAATAPRVTTPPAKPTPKNPPGADADEESVQHRLETFAGLLVLVGALQFFALIVQAFVFFCTLTETQKINRIAQRGYLYVANVTVKRPTEGQIEIKYPIYNAGVTPATLQGINDSFEVAHSLRHIQPAKQEAARFREKRTVIPPNSEIGVGGEYNQSLADEEISILNAGGSIFFYGILQYRDIFGDFRYLGFGFRTRAKLEVGSCESGMGFIPEVGFNWFD
jgi:hypothetical protein